MDKLLFFVLGGLTVLVGLVAILIRQRKIILWRITLVWSEEGQQVSRLQLTRTGDVFLIKNAEGGILYVDSGANALATMKRTIKTALADADYFKWLRDEVVAGRKVHIQIVEREKSEAERKALVKDYIARTRPLLNATNEIKDISGFIEIEENNDTSNAGTIDTRDRAPAGLRPEHFEEQGGLTAFTI